MKKKYVITIALILCAFSLAACGVSSKRGDSGKSADGRKISVVTTIFPAYDWAKNIIGEGRDDVSLTMLIDNGVDLHSFQPTAEDIKNLSECDVFIYVGGESDGWVEDALKEAGNADMVVINLLDTLGDKVKEEEVIEGMQAGDAHGHNHEHEHEDGESHEEGDDNKHEWAPEYDEHVWLSLKNADLLCRAISEKMAAVDPSHADDYTGNTAEYCAKLSALDAKYQAAADNGTVKTLLFGDRFPFRYLTDDYGLDYYAAFIGCSAETEASFETIAFLSGKADELGLKNIMTIEGEDHKLAESIISNTKNKDKKILTMDSMQSTTAEDIGKGADYLSVMEGNLEVLTEALR